MKKSTLIAMLSVLNGEGVTNIDTIRDEIEAELNKGAEERAAKEAKYNALRERVAAILRNSEVPMSIKEVYEALADETISRGTVQYGMTFIFNDMLIKDNSRKPAVYSLRA